MSRSGRVNAGDIHANFVHVLASRDVERAAVAIAERDTIVPARFGKALYETLGEPRRLAVIDGAGHNDWTGQVDAAWWQDAVAFLTRRLSYDLHLRFLRSLELTDGGDHAAASVDYLESSGPARKLLREAGYATSADWLDPSWDSVILKAARLVVRTRNQ